MIIKNVSHNTLPNVLECTPTITIQDSTSTTAEVIPIVSSNTLVYTVPVYL